MLPGEVDWNYHLRLRRHDWQLIATINKMNNNDFILCMLYKHCYWFVMQLLVMIDLNMPVCKMS